MHTVLTSFRATMRGICMQTRVAVSQNKWWRTSRCATVSRAVAHHQAVCMLPGESVTKFSIHTPFSVHSLTIHIFQNIGWCNNLKILNMVHYGQINEEIPNHLFLVIAVSPWYCIIQDWCPFHFQISTLLK